MFTITFYSYKGGVGRTLALMNVAERLANRGKRVFILDFDLEAPGVDSFPGSPESSQGLVEYFGIYLNETRVPRIADYVYELPERSHGRIYVMPAGTKDAGYRKLLSQIDWKVLYGERQGYFLVENLKEAIVSDFNPDYLLVDSRTGLTDISGVCTVQLPNLVVMLFNLNSQNINGTAHIYKSIKNNSIGRKIDTLLVATPIPDVPAHLGLRKERLELAEKTIGSSVDAILPFEPFVSFREMFVPADSERSYLGMSYNELTDKIIDKNEEDSLSKLALARKVRDIGDIDGAIKQYEELVEQEPDFVDAWTDLSLLSTIRGDLDSAGTYLYKALALRPSDPAILTKLATMELRRGNAEKADDLFAELLTQSKDEDSVDTLTRTFMKYGRFSAAQRGFERIVELEGEEADEHSYHFLGQVLMAQHKVAEALGPFRAAYKLSPNDVIHIYNYAYVSALLGLPESDALYEKAIEVYEGNNEEIDSARDDANVLQAMSNAYLAIHKRGKAVQCLYDAIAKANSSGRQEFFSCLQYRDIPLAEFVEECQVLLRRIAEASTILQ